MTHSFEYHAPQSLDEALALLDEHGSNARLLAGGTDLLLNIREGHLQPAHVISLRHIGELRRFEMNGDGLFIGALVSAAELTQSSIVREDYPALAEAAASIAAVQIRNMATVGGNLCNASPAADLAPPLIALEASVEIAGKGGQRALGLGDFFTGPGKTALRPDEMLVGVRVPARAVGWRCAFLKMSPRRAMDIAVVNVAVALTGDGDTCEDARIVMGAVGPTPLRAEKAEAVLRGKPLNPENIRRAAQLASEDAMPIDDVRASAWYRERVVVALVERALLGLIGEKMV